MGQITEDLNVKVLTALGGIPAAQYNEDWHKFLTLKGVPLGQINERLIAYAQTLAGGAKIVNASSALLFVQNNLLTAVPHNFITYSENVNVLFTDWIGEGGTNGALVLAPNGTVSATPFSEDATLAKHDFYETLATVQSVSFVMACKVKTLAGSRNIAIMALYGAGTNGAGVVLTSAGVWVNTFSFGAGLAVTAHTEVADANGYVKVTLTFSFSGPAVVSVQCTMLNGTDVTVNNVYQGVITNTVVTDEWQLNAGTVLDIYQLTNATPI